MHYPVMSGSEHFQLQGKACGETVKDFWAWSRSRLLADGPRGDLAEFIVNTALGLDTKNAKRGWGECDIVYRDIRIEIKCSSLLQAWEHPKKPRPVFSIAKTQNCDIEETETGYRYIGRDGLPPQRRSEIYVFCLFSNTDRSTANPLDLDQWSFYIVPTCIINQRCQEQRSISIGKIEKLGYGVTFYHEIKPTVDAMIDSQEL